MFDGQYLSYIEYTALGGLLTESAFKLLEYEARKKVNKYTSGRLVELTEQKDDVKLCINKLIGVLNTNNTTIKGESVDGYSYTMMSKKELESAIYSIIKDYLAEDETKGGIPYLYVGADNLDNESIL